MHIPDIHAKRYAHYADMRANNPVHFNTERKVWEIYGYYDIQTVLGDPATFSSDIHTAARRAKAQTIGTMDPPRHTQLRKLLTRAFTTKTVTDLEPGILAVTNELLDRATVTGRMDVIADFALPLPLTIISQLLGVPISDQGKFKRWSKALVEILELAFQGQVAAPQLLKEFDEVTQYMETLAIERQTTPKMDLISGLANANVDGEQLTIQEIANTCRSILVAGHETTTNLIGNALHLLLAHPDTLAQLRAKPELIPSAIEEVLRYRAPGQFFGRVATRDVVLGGKLIQAGQPVVTFNGSGNLDEAAFPNANHFDITRSPNRHLSLGHGIHYCLGAGLSRLEALIGINTILQRFPKLRLDASQAIEPLQSSSLTGVRSLPVLLT